MGKNPDLQGIICFGIDWSEAYHAGQDLYRIDGLSTEGAEVTAIANGIVFHVSNPDDINYPGITIILTHTLPSTDIIYSVYMHLDEPIEVSEGQVISRGQKLGEVISQSYSGRYPEYHSGDDSHLHFEIRHFADGRYIYTDYPACNHPHRVAGAGYTYPDHPDIFPTSMPYVKPSIFIKYKIYLPLILKSYPVILTPTPTATSTPTPTATPIPCINGEDLITDGGLENPNLHHLWIQDDGEPGTDWPLIDDAWPYEGTYGIWLGGRDNANEEIYQAITLPTTIISATATFQLYVVTQETLPNDYDIMYWDLKDNQTGNSILINPYTHTNQFQPIGEWDFRSVTVIGLDRRAGEVIRVSLSDTTDISNHTSFYVDNVAFITYCQ